MFSFLCLAYFVSGLGGLFQEMSTWGESSKQTRIRERKERWLADHPNERWKCPYK